MKLAELTHPVSNRKKFICITYANS